MIDDCAPLRPLRPPCSSPVHHVQHHTQPVITSQQLPDTHREKIHPVTRIEEQHVNKVEDNTLFEGQVFQHRNTVDRAPTERVVVDKGTSVVENVHHHIHHVIQPVIEKESTSFYLSCSYQSSDGY